MQLPLEQYIPEFESSLGEELLTPTRLYPKICLPLLKKFDLHGLVHITGGGFYDNIPRVLPADCDALLDTSAWPLPPVFRKLQEWGSVAWKEMYRTFNMGIGMILIVSSEEAPLVRAALSEAGEICYELGSITSGTKQAILKGGVFDERA
jgi:phosphoribosylformylglycinamidine cyclo-ligase